MPIQKNEGGGQCINVVTWLFSVVFWYQLIIIFYMLSSFEGIVATTSLDEVSPNHHLKQGASLFTTEDFGGKLQSFGVFFWWLFPPPPSPRELSDLFLKQNSTGKNKIPGLRMKIKWMFVIAQYVCPVKEIKKCSVWWQTAGVMGLGWRCRSLSHQRATRISYIKMNLTEVPFITHAGVIEMVDLGRTFSNGDRDASQVGPPLCE